MLAAALVFTMSRAHADKPAVIRIGVALQGRGGRSAKPTPAGKRLSKRARSRVRHEAIPIGHADGRQRMRVEMRIVRHYAVAVQYP
ncbi:hypothetical protein BH160DRAFT_0371, partial [Burkholderia sp. H160]